MTRTERTIVQHWRGLATVCAIVALFGVSWALWHRVDSSDRKYVAAVAEANKRGDAVSTLAGDVRALRAQVQAAGKTPVAPDPARAVSNLPDRTEVPVPIPGPAGQPGPSGSAGKSGTNGKDGTAGQPGADSTVPGPAGSSGVAGPVGPAGPPGAAGKDGTDGKDGTNGQTCPDGYSLQPLPSDPDYMACHRDSAPSPTPSSPSAQGMAALPPDRRRI